MAEESTATPQPAPGTPEAPARDYAALDAELRQLGDGVSLDTIVERSRDWRTQMGVAQQKAADAEKQLEWAKPLQKYMQQDPKFADHVRTSIESYFNPETGEREYREVESQPVPQELQDVTNPVMATVMEMKTRMDAMDQQRDMTALKSEFVDHITPDVERSIYLRMAETGITDPKQHFIYMKGSEVVNQARQAGIAEGRARRSAGAAYGGTNPATGGGVLADVTPSKEVAKMDKREHDNFAEGRIAEIMGQ